MRFHDNSKACQLDSVDEPSHLWAVSFYQLQGCKSQWISPWVIKQFCSSVWICHAELSSRPDLGTSLNSTCHCHEKLPWTGHAGMWVDICFSIILMTSVMVGPCAEQWWIYAFIPFMSIPGSGNGGSWLRISLYNELFSKWATLCHYQHRSMVPH